MAAHFPCKLPYRVVGMQVIVVSAVALLMLLEGTKQAGSAVLGGVVSVLPNAYFAWVTSRPGRFAARSPELEAGRLLAQSVMKFVVAVVAMVIVIRTAAFEPFGFFCAFVAGWLVQLAAPLQLVAYGIHRAK